MPRPARSSAPRPTLLVALLALAATATLAWPAAAHAADDQLRVRTVNGAPGWVALELRAAPGTTVRVSETDPANPGAAPALVLERTTKQRSTRARRLARARCDQRDRRFTIDLLAPGQPPAQVQRTVRTPSCAGRLTLALAPTAAGKPLHATVTDRYGQGGVSSRVCAKGPTGAKTCRDLTLADGRRRATVPLGRARAGRTTVTLRNPWGRDRIASLSARSPTAGFRLLATGDSMIQIIDSYLTQRLKPRKGSVRSDAHISTGISKPAMLNWTRHAKASAGSIKPDVTVVFLGANDGFPMSGVACCGDGWSRIYASRVESMMRSYLRGGRGRVIWLLLPAPRGGSFASVFRGVNAAVQLAATRFNDDQVTVLDLRKTFTPGGSYRGSIRWNGVQKQVRQGDGVHFNTAGASIAADLIIRQLRRDGFVR